MLNLHNLILALHIITVTAGENKPTCNVCKTGLAPCYQICDCTPSGDHDSCRDKCQYKRTYEAAEILWKQTPDESSEE
ncbi:hypothetical protein N0V91_002718 [Didymella pomorum]|uniref:Uncharacterized protein n=1 Tax=Didymella pomorum TaxID=749634 RepID=A0A9W8ZI71_9PLEO|nr:hypothetical protein N0V91_002718 [Didymella pomorum]